MHRRLLTPGWLLLHALTVAMIGTFLGLGWWQVGRAQHGSLNSVAYALEWPVFALFTGFMWWRVVRDRGGPRVPATPRPPRDEPTAAPAPPVTDDEDPELAAYNRYLAELNERAQLVSNASRRGSEHRRSTPRPKGRGSEERSETGGEP